MKNYRPFLTTVGLALALSLALDGFVALAQSNPPGGPRPPLALGVYFNEEKVYAPADEQAFADLQAQTGRLAKLYMNFQSWSEEYKNFSPRLADNSLRHGGIFMVVWEPRVAGAPTKPGSFLSCADIAAGAQDAYIQQYAADVKKWGGPVMIRFAHEMNGKWYPWGVGFDAPGVRHNGNTPYAYTAMWRHVWKIFDAAGATNVFWVWAPNIFNPNLPLDQQRADYAALYPGDAYVDWIGLDGYNDGVKSSWKSFPELFDASYHAITALTHKPLMIAEFAASEKGAPPGTSKAAWITQTLMTDIPRRYPRIQLVNWFNRDKSKQGETDWRFNSSPAALAAYAAAVNSPLYQGDILLAH